MFRFITPRIFIAKGIERSPHSNLDEKGLESFFKNVYSNFLLEDMGRRCNKADHSTFTAATIDHQATSIEANTPNPYPPRGKLYSLRVILSSTIFRHLRFHSIFVRLGSIHCIFVVGFSANSSTSKPLYYVRSVKVLGSFWTSFDSTVNSLLCALSLYLERVAFSRIFRKRRSCWQRFYGLVGFYLSSKKPDQKLLFKKRMPKAWERQKNFLRFFVYW